MYGQVYRNSLIFIKKNIFLLTGLFVIGFLILNDDGENYNLAVLLISFTIFAFSLYRMFQLNGRPFSLNKIFYIFSLFFLGIAPALQYKFNISFNGGGNFSSIDYFEANFIIFITVLIYDLSYKYFFSKPVKHVKQFKSRKSILPIKRKKALRILLLISLVSFLLYFYSQGFNILALLIRGGIEYESPLDANFGPLGLIIKIFVRPIPVISLIIYKCFYKKFGLYDIIFLLLVLVSNAPTGMPRFQAAALYIPIAIIYFKSFSKNINFSLAISGGLFVVFPLLNIFRRFTSLSVSGKFNNNLFLTGNFDSYYNFLLVLDNKIVTWGEQLLGVLFFFVPRSIWENKPTGSGSFVANEVGLTFSNISMNYFAEGYINFGYLGIFLFCIIIAYVNSSLDKKFWGNNRYLLTEVVYLFLLGMEFFILRGDLLSSFAYTSGLMLSIALIYILVTRKVEYPSNR
jgi:oligosaccharide repeat unit polymerase